MHFFFAGPNGIEWFCRFAWRRETSRTYWWSATPNYTSVCPHPLLSFSRQRWPPVHSNSSNSSSSNNNSTSVHRAASSTTIKKRSESVGDMAPSFLACSRSNTVHENPFPGRISSSPSIHVFFLIFFTSSSPLFHLFSWPSSCQTGALVAPAHSSIHAHTKRNYKRKRCSLTRRNLPFSKTPL